MREVINQKIAVQWRCDACGEKEIFEIRDEFSMPFIRGDEHLPNGWYYVDAATKMVENTPIQVRSKHFCSAFCMDKYMKLLYNLPLEEENV